jgi:hypothetical protein
VLSGEHPPYLGRPDGVPGFNELILCLFGNGRVMRLVGKLDEHLRVFDKRAYPVDGVDAGCQLCLSLRELLRLFRVVPDG